MNGSWGARCERLFRRVARYLLVVLRVRAEAVDQPLDQQRAERRVRGRVVGVELDRALERPDGFGQARGRVVQGERASLLHEAPCVEIVRRLLPRGVNFGAERLCRERRDDRARDVLLDGQQVGTAPVVALGPDLRAADGFVELREDPKVRSVGLDASRNDVVDVQPFADLSNVGIRLFQRERRAARRDAQSIDARERVLELGRKRVADVNESGIGRMGIERQHSNGRDRARGARRRRGDRSLFGGRAAGGTDIAAGSAIRTTGSTSR